MPAATELDDDAAYDVLKARDARYDGLLFVGVSSTGVYCRPVCRVRLPLRKNCRFFASRALAEAAAFRPCMKCRPEIAPGLSAMDSSRTLADTAARRIEHAVHSGQALSLPDLAAKLGVTDRHLRRIFQATHGVAPHDYLTTQRLLLAKQLLTDSDQPVTQVALASGFESLRRFNAAFAERYRLNPTQLRREGGSNSKGTTLRLAYRPPYDRDAVLSFYAQRQVQGVEWVDGESVHRTLSVKHRGQPISGWISTRFVADRHEVQVEVSASLRPLMGTLLHAVRRSLDLDADPALIDPVLRRLPVPLRPGTRLPGALDGFDGAVRVILGQQVTVKAARTLTQRLVDRFGTRIETPFPALTHVFPDAATLAAADPADIGTLGIVRQRVAALQALASAVSVGEINLDSGAGAGVETTMTALRALPGVGEWTAQVIAMRSLSWPDAWPASDIGLMNALGSRDAKHLTALAEPWRPWRAYAVMRLWTALEERAAPVPAAHTAGQPTPPTSTTNRP